MDPRAPPDVDRRVSRERSLPWIAVSRELLRMGRVCTSHESFVSNFYTKGTQQHGDRICTCMSVLAFGLLTPLRHTRNTKVNYSQNHTHILRASSSCVDPCPPFRERHTVKGCDTLTTAARSFFGSVREAIAWGERDITEYKRDLALAPHWR